MLIRFGLLLFLFFLFNASSCEREVELDLNAPEDKLVLYSNFTPGSDITLQVGKSRSVINQDPEEFLPGADVSLYEDDVFLEKLDFKVGTDALPPIYQSSQTEVKNGKKYRVEVSLDGFDDVTAESHIPIPSTIKDFYSFDLMVDKDSNPGLVKYSYKVNAKINDVPNVTNYYHLIMYQVVFHEIINDGMLDTIPTLELMNFDISSNTNDVVSYLNQGILVKDNPFSNGYQFDFNIEINPLRSYLGLALFELRTVSEDYYLFYTSIARQQGITNTLFAEPIFIYENVSNGYGIFAGYSNQVAAIRILE